MNITIRNKYETIEEFELTEKNLHTAINDVLYLTQAAASADCHVYHVHVFIGEFLIDAKTLYESQNVSIAQEVIGRSKLAMTAIEAFDSSNENIIEIKELLQKWISLQEIPACEKIRVVNFMYEKANLMSCMLLTS